MSKPNKKQTRAAKKAARQRKEQAAKKNFAKIYNAKTKYKKEALVNPENVGKSKNEIAEIVRAEIQENKETILKKEYTRADLRNYITKFLMDASQIEGVFAYDPATKDWTTEVQHVSDYGWIRLRKNSKGNKYFRLLKAVIQEFQSYALIPEIYEAVEENFQKIMDAHTYQYSRAEIDADSYDAAVERFKQIVVDARRAIQDIEAAYLKQVKKHIKPSRLDERAAFQGATEASIKEIDQKVVKKKKESPKKEATQEEREANMYKTAFDLILG